MCNCKLRPEIYGISPKSEEITPLSLPFVVLNVFLIRTVMLCSDKLHSLLLDEDMLEQNLFSILDSDFLVENITSPTDSRQYKNIFAFHTNVQTASIPTS